MIGASAVGPARWTIAGRRGVNRSARRRRTGRWRPRPRQPSPGASRRWATRPTRRWSRTRNSTPLRRVRGPARVDSEGWREQGAGLERASRSLSGSSGPRSTKRDPCPSSSASSSTGVRMGIEGSSRSGPSVEAPPAPAASPGQGVRPEGIASGRKWSRTVWAAVAAIAIDKASSAGGEGEIGANLPELELMSSPGCGAPRATTWEPA